MMMTMLVTGGHGGLGHVVVERARAAGWHVVAPASDELNVLDAEAVQRYVDAIAGDLRAVVTLVGGIRAGMSVSDTPDDVVRSMFDMNVLSVVNVVRAAWTHLRVQGGSIVTIGARDVMYPQAMRSAYGASKAAVVGYTRAIAEEGRADGIRANVLLPGIIRTAANLAWADAATVATMISPEAIAETILDLCRPDNGVSGATLPMFGGMTS